MSAQCAMGWKSQWFTRGATSGGERGFRGPFYPDDVRISAKAMFRGGAHVTGIAREVTQIASKPRPLCPCARDAATVCAQTVVTGPLNGATEIGREEAARMAHG